MATAEAQDTQGADPQNAADPRPERLRCPACGTGQLKRVNSRDTPQNWLQVLSLSPFGPPFNLWDQLDLADWTPVLEDDPPAPLGCFRQLYLPLVFHQPRQDKVPSDVRCRGDPMTQSCGPTLCWEIVLW
jgi:hypothetical protein